MINFCHENFDPSQNLIFSPFFGKRYLQNHNIDPLIMACSDPCRQASSLGLGRTIETGHNGVDPATGQFYDAK
jgi:hypothetical protein